MSRHRDGENEDERASVRVEVSADAEVQGKTLPWGDASDGSDVRKSSRPRDTSSEPPPDEPRMGRMVAARVIGDGGMGRVYEAHDPELGRDVAVKRMHDNIAQHPGMRARFIAEAQITAQLEHPNIVPIYDVGTTEAGTAFLVMKRVRGRSLRDVLDALQSGDARARQQWTRHRLLNSFLKVCQALAYAHAQGVLHRDLKPANIMLGEFGEVLVLDWGVAKRQSTPADVPERPSRHTSEGTIVGTPGYMSPEQVLGKIGQLDARTDVWSLGAILYEILTTQPAYRGDGAVELLLKSVRRRPTPPPLRAPGADVPRELSDICYQALEPDPEKRTKTASELAEAVEAFLEGSRRRQEADRHLEQAERVWASYDEHQLRRAQLLGDEKRHGDAADAWAPLSEKQELLRTRMQLAELEPRRAKVFGEVVTLCEKALAHDPTHMGARAALARAYWTRLEEAEQKRDEAGIAYYADRVASYDDGSYAKLLEGTGALSLATDPPGAEVICERYEQHGLVYPLVDTRVLGTTPLDHVPMPMGSYLLTLKCAGYRDVRYPLHIGRARHWDGGSKPVALHPDDHIGEGFVYVPAGPLVYGGDADAPGSKPLDEVWVEGFAIARFPVTVEQYLELITDLHERDPAEAWRRCPRSEGSLSASEGQYFQRPRAEERYRLPEVDADGNEWDPSWPVFGVSWQDASTYARWASERDGVTYRLAFEHEREKATRGVDGRFYPWGDGFDRTLCKMGDSRRGRARPEPIGAFPTDVSVYGVRDTAGSMRDWCADAEFDGDATLRPVRGGSWNYDPRFCRAACRLGRPPWRVFAYNGFRLVKSLA